MTEQNKTLSLSNKQIDQSVKTVTEQLHTKSNLAQTTCLNSMIELIKRPVLTEKTSLMLTKNRQYTFDVHKSLTKTQIKKLFETLFEVNVIGINTHIPPRKTVRVGLTRGYRPTYKRVIITLKQNQSIVYNFANK